MTRIASLFASACLSGFVLTACAEAATETHTQAGLSQEAETEAPVLSAADRIVEEAPATAWRTVELENLIRMETSKGTVWIELAPEFTPRHAVRMRELARSGWLDWKVFHRVIDGFMAQGGGAIDNPNISAPTQPVQAEFTRQRDPNTLIVTEIQDRVINDRRGRDRAQAGFFNGFPAGTQPAALAGILATGRVESWLLHCTGAASMARTNDPNSGNAQFYIVNGDAEHLNTQYTVWGKVRLGMEVVDSFNEGTIGETLGFQPDIIEAFDVATDLDAADQISLQVMDTRSPSFTDYLEALAAERANGRLPDICEIDVPVRVAE